MNFVYNVIFLWSEELCLDHNMDLFSNNAHKGTRGHFLTVQVENKVGATVMTQCFVFIIYRPNKQNQSDLRLRLFIEVYYREACNAEWKPCL